MPRPLKPRCVRGMPPATFYKPQGVPLSELKGVVLTIEGFEALSLVDGEGLSQEEAAQHMCVSRPTLCRVLGQARRTVARALAGGWALRIEGGEYAMTAPAEPRGGYGRDGKGPRRKRGALLQHNQDNPRRSSCPEKVRAEKVRAEEDKAEEDKAERNKDRAAAEEEHKIGVDAVALNVGRMEGDVK